jgi:hypothetical protein
VLGGTSQLTYDNAEPDSADQQAILNNVCVHLPSLRRCVDAYVWLQFELWLVLSCVFSSARAALPALRSPPSGPSAADN